MTENKINSFLKIGYCIDYNNTKYKVNFDNIDKLKYANATEHELKREGIDLFNKAISKKFDAKCKNVVPISGGLDSRAILGALLKHTEAKNIKTYTFGTPGTYDYEIGNLIAKKYGTIHTSIDLTKQEYCMEDLTEMSKRVNHQTVLFHHPPVKYLDDIIEDSTVWSGAIIDVLFGRHKHKLKSNEIEVAKENFLNENIYQKDIQLHNNESNLLSSIDFDEEIASKIGYEHYLDIVNRQLKFIAPHVLADGYKYNVLFEDDELVSFALSLPEKYIEDQYLYKKMFLEEFSEIFMIPTKTNYGLSLNSNPYIVKLSKNILRSKLLVNRFVNIFQNPLINYIDFETGIRDRRDLNKIVYNNINDLKDRNIIDWIDIEKIWSEYINSKKNYAKALILLTSLEINLKAQELNSNKIK